MTDNETSQFMTCLEPSPEGLEGVEAMWKTRKGTQVMLHNRLFSDDGKGGGHIPLNDERGWAVAFTASVVPSS